MIWYYISAVTLVYKYPQQKKKGVQIPYGNKAFTNTRHALRKTKMCSLWGGLTHLKDI